MLLPHPPRIHTHRFSGRALLLVCISGAKAGQELTLGYGGADWMPVQQRRSALSAQYGFDCTCPACVPSPALEVQEAAALGMACPVAGCDGAVVPCGAKVTPGALSDPGMWPPFASSPRAAGRCVVCGAAPGTDEVCAALEQLTAAARDHAAGSDLLLQLGAHSQQRPMNTTTASTWDKAASLLAAAAARRDAHLHVANVLRGASHHDAACAALELAAGCSRAVEATSGGDAQTPLRLLPLAVLDTSDACGMWQLAAAVASALERHLRHRSHHPDGVLLAQSAFQAVSRAAVQYLRSGLEHLRGSVAVLQHCADLSQRGGRSSGARLGLAVEQLLAAAAAAALLASGCCGCAGAGCSPGRSGLDACCAATGALLADAAQWHASAQRALRLHLGELGGVLCLC